MPRRGFEDHCLVSGWLVAWAPCLFARVPPHAVIGVDPPALGRVRVVGTLALGVSGTVRPWILRHVAH